MITVFLLIKDLTHCAMEDLVFSVSTVFCAGVSRFCFAHDKDLRHTMLTSSVFLRSHIVCFTFSWNAFSVRIFSVSKEYNAFVNTKFIAYSPLQSPVPPLGFISSITC